MAIHWLRRFSGGGDDYGALTSDLPSNLPSLKNSKASPIRPRSLRRVLEQHHAIRGGTKSSQWTFAKRHSSFPSRSIVVTSMRSVETCVVGDPSKSYSRVRSHSVSAEVRGVGSAIVLCTFSKCSIGTAAIALVKGRVGGVTSA